MEGLLCRWALAQQEFNFTIKYRKGCLNNDADAISCSMLPSFSVATCVLTDIFKDQLQAAQHDDSILKQIISTLQTSSKW